MPSKKKLGASKGKPKSSSSRKISRTTNHKSSKLEQKPFPFLDLPTELREQIYINYVRARFISGIPEKYRFQYEKTRGPILYRCRCLGWKTAAGLPHNSLALSLVNRQTYAEIQSIIYQEVQPTFQLNLYVPVGKDGRTPGQFCDKDTNTKLSNFNGRFISQFASGLCMTKVQMGWLAKFRNVMIDIICGPRFLDGPEYLAILAALRPFHNALKSQTRTYPMELHFCWMHLYPDNEEGIPKIDQILRWERLEMARETINWQFKFLKKVEFSSNGEVPMGWEFEEDEDFHEDPETDGRWFWTDSLAHGKKGFIVVEVVDEHESDMSELDMSDRSEDEKDRMSTPSYILDHREYNSDGKLVHEYDSDGDQTIT